MPRGEARIFTSIWKDREFLSLSATAQRLFMFLLSQEDLTYCGVMPLRPPRWVPKAAGLTLGELEQDLKALEAAGRMFVVSDHDTGELMVRSLMRHDGIWKQPNLMKLARESAGQVESPRMRGVMLAELWRLPLAETGSDLVKTLVADFINDLDKGGPYPTAYPTGHPTEIGSDHPSDNPDRQSPDDPTDKDYARAQGLGETLIRTVIPGPRTPSPVPPTSRPAGDSRRGTRLPEDFAVTPEMVAWARQNAPHVDGKRETERFVDYWLSKPGKEGRKLDWNRTWQNWMRTAEDRQGPRDRPGSGQRQASGYEPYKNTTDQSLYDTQKLRPTR